jgi:plastocyanin
MDRPLAPGPLLAAILAATLLGTAPVAAKDVSVRITNFTFVPAQTTIAPGDTVTFVNEDDMIHSLVADDGSFHSGGLDTGDKATFTFPKAGRIGYHCGLHPFMKGEIMVQ